MNIKKVNVNKIISYLLFFTVLTFSCNANQSEKKTVKENIKDTQLTNVNSKIIIYYFHTAYRCTTCNLFEKLTKEVINSNFSSELENGKIEFKSINTEEAEHRHFVNDYKLVTKSLILSFQDMKEEKEWHNLDKIWILIRDTTAFKKYVLENIKNYMKKL